eukprot:8898651-Pyramimonas_sp.AAC.1
MPVYSDGKPVEHTAGMLALAEMLEDNDSIATLNLRENCIGPAGVKLLVKALSNSDSALAYIDLSGNLLGPDGCAVSDDVP